MKAFKVKAATLEFTTVAICAGACCIKLYLHSLLCFLILLKRRYHIPHDNVHSITEERFSDVSKMNFKCV